MPNTSRLASSKVPPMTPRWVLTIVTALMLGASVSAHAATIQITMENLVISPAEASAKVGDTIERINKDIFVLPRRREMATGHTHPLLDAYAHAKSMIDAVIGHQPSPLDSSETQATLKQKLGEKSVKTRRIENE
jgi:hypothetical protein